MLNLQRLTLSINALAFVKSGQNPNVRFQLQTTDRDSCKDEAFAPSFTHLNAIDLSQQCDRPIVLAWNGSFYFLERFEMKFRQRKDFSLPLIVCQYLTTAGLPLMPFKILLWLPWDFCQPRSAPHHKYSSGWTCLHFCC